MGRATWSATAACGCVALVVAACSPTAIPLSGELPKEQLATVMETDDVGLKEDGYVEITRIDGAPVPEGRAYSLKEGKHSVELLRQSPTQGDSNSSYFLRGGVNYLAWNGCTLQEVKKGEDTVEKLVCDQPPQLLPEDALDCYQKNRRSSEDCKEATERWNESGAAD